jgi:uncharacterized membrane protein
VYRFNGQASRLVYVPTSPLPMSGVTVFAAVDSVHRVDMQVDDLMKISLSIGVMSSSVIPNQYVVDPGELRCTADRLNNNRSAADAVNSMPNECAAVESEPQRKGSSL